MEQALINELFDYLVELYDKRNSDIAAYSRSPGPLDRRFGRYLSKMQKIYPADKAGAKAIVRDYIAGMTDDYAIRCMSEISLPEELSFDRSIPLPNNFMHQWAFHWRSMPTGDNVVSIKEVK